MPITSHTVYKTADGAVHWSLPDAESHQAVLDAIDAIMSTIGPARHIDYGKYIQRDINAVWAARRAVIQDRLPHLLSEPGVSDALKNRTLVRGSVIGRYIDECAPAGRSAWFRLECIDDQGREWDQPYFATHPEKGSGAMLDV